jgi:hypothetical protein
MSVPPSLPRRRLPQVTYRSDSSDVWIMEVRVHFVYIAMLLYHERTTWLSERIVSSKINSNNSLPSHAWLTVGEDVFMFE